MCNNYNNKKYPQFVNHLAAKEMYSQERYRQQTDNLVIIEMIKQARTQKDAELRDWIGQIPGVQPGGLWARQEQQNRPVRPAGNDWNDLDKRIAGLIDERILVNEKLRDHYDEKLNKVRSDHQTEISTLKLEHQKLVAELEAKITSNQQKLEAAHSKLKTFENKNKALLERLEKSTKQVSDLKNSKKQLEKLKDEGLLENAQLKASVQALNVKISDLENEISEHGAVVQQRDSLRTNVDNLSAELAQSKKDYGELSRCNTENAQELFNMRLKHRMGHIKREYYNPHIHTQSEFCEMCFIEKEKLTSEDFVVVLVCGHVVHEKCANNWKSRCDLEEPKIPFRCPACGCNDAFRL